MTRLIRDIVLCCFLVSVTACSHRREEQQQQLRTADSLMTALTLVSTQLRNIDTNLLLRAITRYGYHQQFLSQALKDTISKTQADDLQNFMQSGEYLRSFSTARRSVLERCSSQQLQLKKLRIDIENNAIEPAEARQHLSDESREMQTSMAAVQDLSKNFHRSMEQFRMALPGTEQLIRKHNNGRLPTVIRDTTSI